MQPLCTHLLQSSCGSTAYYIYKDACDSMIAARLCLSKLHVGSYFEDGRSLLLLPCACTLCTLSAAHSYPSEHKNAEDIMCQCEI